MRLPVLALTALAFTQPALAREHDGARRWAPAVHAADIPQAHHHLVRLHGRHHALRSAAAWRRHGRLAQAGMTHLGIAKRVGQFDGRPSEIVGAVEHKRAAGPTALPWSNAYASASPSERIAQLRAPALRYRSHRHVARWR